MTPWSPEDDALLLRLVGFGVSYPTIGRRLERSVASCRWRYGRLTSDAPLKARGIANGAKYDRQLEDKEWEAMCRHGSRMMALALANYGQVAR